MQNILFTLKNYFKEIIIGILIIICGSLIWCNFKINEEKESDAIIANNSEITIKKENDNQPEETRTIFVDIKGAIKKPGVYEMDEKAIINDVIKLAGGFNSNAYKNNINLSKKVSDEMVIYVYNKTEYKNKSTSNKETVICKTPSYEIDNCTNDKVSIIENDKDNNDSEPNDNVNIENNTLININKATINDLTTIKGIGDAKAKTIIEYRDKNGAFKSINDIINVTGIGESLFEKIKDYITV